MTAALDTTPRRTDPRTFAVRAVGLLWQLALPIAVASVTILDKGDLGDMIVYFLPLVAVVVGLNILFAYLRWRRLTYTVGVSDIRMESGLLSRSARSVPYERIQDVSLEQKLVPRLFGLVEVKFETGAGGGEDIALAYLQEAEGERLRELVRSRRESEPVRGEAGAEAAAEPAPDARLLHAMSPRRVITFGLFEFSLAVVTVVAGFAQQVDFLLPFEIWDWNAWREQLSGPGQWLAGLGFLAQVIGGVLAASSLLLVGVVTGVVRTALREWGFRLERTDKGLRRRRGLLTRTDLVMPVHRVQALRLGTGFVRRLFGWHSLKLVSLASDSGSANHEAMPFAQMEEITPVVAETGFHLPPGNTDWRRSSRRYRFDEFLFGLGLMLAITAILLVADQIAFAPIPLLGGGAWFAIHEYLRWRWDRHAIGERQLYTRHGWFAPQLAIASREKLQSVEIVRNPIARLRGYADIHFGLAGGRLRMKGIELEEARRIRDAVAQSMARPDFSEVVEGDPAQA